jgi:hypothetical protein
VFSFSGILWRMEKDFCSICRSSAAVRDAVNHALEKRVKMRDIAKQSGFSKSAIHRHSQNCRSRQVLLDHRARRAHVRDRKIVIVWPNKAIPKNLDENSIVIRVVYEQQPVGNPGALINDGWTAESQETFLRFCSHEVKQHYINGVHEGALVENVERNFAGLPISDNQNMHLN